jgi:hypothetical protein
MIIGTWNMQGAKDDGESRWTAGVTQLLKEGKCQTLLLQECGAPPKDANLMIPERRSFAGRAPATDIPLLFGVWNVGTSKSEKTIYMYHCDWDAGGGRCNLAILSYAQPGWLTFDPNPLASGARPMIGMALPGGLVTTLHSFSGTGGPDGPACVANTIGQAAAVGAAHWFCGGDMNRDPNTWAGKTPAGAHPWTSGGATYYSSGAELDYGFSDRACDKKNGDDVSTLGAPKSDHLPVRFQIK